MSVSDSSDAPGARPRIALTKGTLRIPPTYFAVQHALEMPDVDWRLLTLAAAVDDPRISLPIDEAVPGAGVLPMRMREAMKWGFIGHYSSLIAHSGADLIHQHQATWSLPALRASRRMRIPLLTTLHGGDAYASSLLSAPERLIERAGSAWTERNLRAARESTRVLAVSRYLADVAVASGFDPSTLHVHYQGVDTEWWCADDEAGERGEIPSLLFVGALSDLKGVPDLLRAHASVSDRHRLVIVGDGPLRRDVERAAAGDPALTYAGPLPREGVRDAMRRSDALILPTRTTRGRAEAAGLVSLEAQACGLPVIVNDVGGAAEMSAPSCSDLLTREYDVDSLASAMRAVIRMGASERRARGAASREWVVANRSTRTAVAELRVHYEELLGA